MEYADRLKMAMKMAGVSVTQLAAGVGVTYQGVKKVIDGGAFGAANNAKAAVYLGVNSDWLATGKGDMHPKVQPVESDPDDLYFFLGEIKDPLQRKLAVHEAIAAIVRVMREPVARPSHTPASVVSPKKPHA